MTEDKLKQIEEMYKRGMSGKEISVATGIPHSTVRQTITRKGLAVARRTIGNLPKQIEERTKEVIMQKVVQSASLLASKRIEEHLQRVMATTGKVMESIAGNLENELHLPAILEHASLDTALRSYDRADGLWRKAAGLPDTVSAVALGGSVGVHENALSVLSSCKILVRDGKADAKTIDIETLKAEMLEDAKPHES